MKEYKYKINGNQYKVGVGELDGNVLQVEVNGVPYRVEMEQKAAATVKPVSTPKPSAAPRTATGDKVIAKPAVAAGPGVAVKAPLPGTIISIPVKVGDTVGAADTIVVLEAMKMENAIPAGRAGKVASIAVNPGDAVLEGAVLLTLE